MARTASRLLGRVAVAAVALACFLGTAEAASAALITIDPGGYDGRYYIAPFSGFSTGRTTVDLADGEYQLDTGASIGGSAFVFTVAGGKVTTVSNGSADASPDGTTLTLRNTSVTINPGSYTGRYFLSSFGSAHELLGAQTVVLVPGLVYTLDGSAHVVASIGGTATASDFLFSVSAAGAVSILPGSPSVPATAAGSVISLNSISVRVDVSPATAAYRVCSQPAGIVDTGSTTVTVIPGLVNCVSDGLNAGYFVAGPSGIQPGVLTVGALTALVTTSASATPATLVSSTLALVTSSPAYATLPAPLQTLVRSALQAYGRLTSPSPAQRAAYAAGLDVLARFGLLTVDQAAVLKTLAARA